MSGMIMVRCEQGIMLASDGGTYVSRENFTLNGFTSKPKVMPHISAVTCMCGTSSLSALVELNHVSEWTSFDRMIEVFRANVVDEVFNCFQYEPTRKRIAGKFFIGGFSTYRERWESYSLEVDTARESFCEGISDLMPAQACMYQPEPNRPSLERYGLDIDALAMNWERPTEFLIPFMRSMRATPRYETAYGEDPAKGAEGRSIIGGFIEMVRIYRDIAVHQVVWRWPDRVGQRINVDDEGEPTLWGLAPDEQA